MSGRDFFYTLQTFVMYKKSPAHSSHFVIILQLTTAVPSAIAIGRLGMSLGRIYADDILTIDSLV
jgi:hypothetical protein